MNLLSYWRKHPPQHLLMQGMAGGFSGVTSNLPARESPKHIESAEEFFSMARGAGIDVNVRPAAPNDPGVKRNGR